MSQASPSAWARWWDSDLVHSFRHSPTAVVAALTTMVSRTPHIMRALRELHRLLAMHNIVLRARYIASADNPADYW